MFVKMGVVRGVASSPNTMQSDISSPPVRTRISLPFVVAVILTFAVLAWWGWYELIRSPYLTHRFMTLDLQFRLAPSAALPSDVNDVHIDVAEGEMHEVVTLDDKWRCHNGNHHGILARASLSYKTSRRVVSLELPGIPEQIWQLDLTSDPDPTLSYSQWRLPSTQSATGVEMSYRLSADR